MWMLLGLEGEHVIPAKVEGANTLVYEEDVGKARRRC